MWYVHICVCVCVCERESVCVYVIREMCGMYVHTYVCDRDTFGG